MYRLVLKWRKFIALAVVIVFIFLGVMLFSSRQKKLALKIKDTESKAEEFYDRFLNELPLVERDVLLNTSVLNVAKEIEDLQNVLEINKNKLKPKPAEIPVNYNVHAFYYAWYGTPEGDGKYYHWNHRFLPHWEKRVSNLYATEQRHKPPDDIGANFFPVLGAYSSMDSKVVNTHMEQFQTAGIGVLALSWYPMSKSDDEGKPVDTFVHTLLDAAEGYGIKVCFHIEPYKERNAQLVREDIKYIHSNYGNHPAFYRTNNPNVPERNNLPLLYVYDSYQTAPEEWSELLTADRGLSIRGTEIDAIVIALLVEKKHKEDILQGGFDGFYTYFASSGFSYGSNYMHWQELDRFSKQNNLLFIPSVGPGYIDTNIRPWNSANTKDRNGGAYYDKEWQSALAVKPKFVSITSFNEWHEGTQIEPAAVGKGVEVEFLLGRKRRGTFSYLSYGEDPGLYLKLTKKWITQFSYLT